MMKKTLLISAVTAFLAGLISLLTLGGSTVFNWPECLERIW